MSLEQFLTHDVIKKLAKNKKWTVSTNDKIPIDIVELVNNNKLMGAHFQDERSLTDLEFIAKTFDFNCGYTYFLSQRNDKYIILDIEPICPDHIKEYLLKLPYIYGEISKSGKGYHLIFNRPKCFNEFTDIIMKPAFIHQKRSFEILLNHYVTFTGNMLPKQKNRLSQNEFEKFFSEFAKKQPKPSKITINFDDSIESIPNFDLIMNLMDNIEYDRSPNEEYFLKADRTTDWSKYEYNYASFLHWKLDNICNTAIVQKNPLNEQQKAYIVYKTLTEKLNERNKHNSQRNNMPFLLYVSVTALERYLTGKQIKEEKKKERKQKQK